MKQQGAKFDEMLMVSKNPPKVDCPPNGGRKLCFGMPEMIRASQNREPAMTSADGSKVAILTERTKMKKQWRERTPEKQGKLNPPNFQIKM